MDRQFCGLAEKKVNRPIHVKIAKEMNTYLVIPDII